MKKNGVLTFTKILYILFAVATVITFFIVYGHIDTKLSFKFLVSYLFFVFFLILYIPSITFLNLRKLEWAKIRKRLFKFFTLFILFISINYISDYFFRDSNIDFIKGISIAGGMAFGLAFTDVIFLKYK